MAGDGVSVVTDRLRQEGQPREADGFVTRGPVRGAEAKIAGLFPAEAAEFDDVAETGVGIWPGIKRGAGSA